MWDGQYVFEKSKIIQGDCLEKMKLLPDGSVDMILADLPYGTTACKWDTIIPFEPLWEQYKRVIKDNGAIVLTGSQPFTSALVMSNSKMFKYEWIWIKNQGSNFAATKYMPMKEHESILVFAKSKTEYKPIMQERSESSQKRFKHKLTEYKGDKREAIGGIKDNGKNLNYNKDERVPSSYQFFNVVPRYKGTLAPTQKPIELFEYLIKTYTNEGDTILDNVAGSGTTGEACINLNRDFILIEKEPNYYEVIKKRVGEIFKNYGLDLQPLLNEQM